MNFANPFIMQLMMNLLNAIMMENFAFIGLCEI